MLRHSASVIHMLMSATEPCRSKAIIILALPVIGLRLRGLVVLVRVVLLVLSRLLRERVLVWGQAHIVVLLVPIFLNLVISATVLASSMGRYSRQHLLVHRVRHIQRGKLIVGGRIPAVRTLRVNLV